MPRVTRRVGIIPERHGVRVPPPAVSPLDPHLATTRVPDDLLGPAYGLPLGVMVRTRALGVRSANVPTSVGIPHDVSIVLRHLSLLSRTAIVRYPVQYRGSGSQVNTPLVP